MSARSRCPVHDLALGPGGECMLCRRSAAPIAPERSEGGSFLGRLVGIGIALAAVGLISTVAIRTLESNRRPPPSRGIQPLSLDLPPAPEAPAPAAAIEPTPAPPSAPRVRARPRRSDELPSAELPVWPPPPEADEPVAAAPSRPVRIESTQPPEPLREPAGLAIDPRLEAARRRVSITMYGTSWCSACTFARTWMRQHDVRFVEHDVDRDTRARERMRALNPRGGVPTIDIGGQHVMVGFSAGELMDAIDRAARR